MCSAVRPWTKGNPRAVAEERSHTVVLWANQHKPRPRSNAGSRTGYSPRRFRTVRWCVRILFVLRRALLVVAQMTYFTLDAGGNIGHTGWSGPDDSRSHVPALARPALVARHMAATTIETRVVDLPSLCRLLLLSCYIIIV